MHYGTYDYGEISSALQHFEPKYAHHEHLPTKHDTVLDTLKRDHDNPVYNMAKNALLGIGYGSLIGLIGIYFKKADPKALTTRVTFQNMYELSHAATISTS